MSNVISLDYYRMQALFKALLLEATTEEDRQKIQDQARRRGVAL